MRVCGCGQARRSATRKRSTDGDKLIIEGVNHDAVAERFRQGDGCAESAVDVTIVLSVSLHHSESPAGCGLTTPTSCAT